jgi:BRCT domain type II-containing protein
MAAKRNAKKKNVKTKPATTKPATRPGGAKVAAKKPGKPKPFDGKRFAFFGEFAVWPRYHGTTPSDLARRRGARLVEYVALADVVVFGDHKGTGRSDAKKAVEKAVAKGAQLEVLDEAQYRELVRVDLKQKSFAFVGGFDCSPEGTGLLESMVTSAGAVTSTVGEQLNYLVVGKRKGPSKIALINQAKKLVEAGAPIEFLDESSFLELVRVDTPAKTSADGTLDFPAFVNRLYGHVDHGRLGRLGRALDMLRSDRFKLFTHLDDAQLVGVVRSQSGSGSVYASWLTPDGAYGCSQPDMEDCMGLQGQVCKHLLVLVVGLVRTNQLPAERGLGWVKSAQGKSPKRNKELCAETFIQYKGAEAGTVDWRPTETVPEDFYAM